MNAQIEIPSDSAKSSSCTNFSSRIGIAPGQSSAAFAFCFSGQQGLLQAVVTPGYHVQFKDYNIFKDKRVARTILTDPQLGTTVEAKITELAGLAHPDKGLFAVEKPTPAAEQLKSTQVGESTARRLALNAPDIVWPGVREGKTSGVLSLYIKQWRFRPYMREGKADRFYAGITFQVR